MKEEVKDIKDGRPTVFEERFYKEIIELRKAGMSVVEVASEFGVCKATLYVWCKQDPDFLDSFIRAKEAWLGWYHRLGRENLHDVQEKGSSRRFNERLYKFIAYTHDDITENPSAGLIELPERYYDAEATVQEKQQILDKMLATHRMSLAVHESLSKTLNMQFEREEGMKIREAQRYLEEKEKEMNASGRI